MARKLHKLAAVAGKGKIDSVRQSDSNYKDGTATLFAAQRCWDSLRKFREERDRCWRYTRGDQWGDLINVDGRTMTEENYLLSEGNVPLKNNLMRKLVRSVVGVYRSQSKEPVCAANDRDEQQLGDTMSVALQVNWKNNKMKELNARMFEEYLISGMAVMKDTWGYRKGRLDCWTDVVNPNYFFFDANMSDPRHWDVTMLGEIHDVSFEVLAQKFAKTRKDYENLKGIYESIRKDYYVNVDREQKARLKNIDFRIPYDTNACRVIEVWSLEHKEQLLCHDYLSGDYYRDEVSNMANIDEENRQRIVQGTSQGMEESEIPLIEYEWKVLPFWYYRFITPHGQILEEGETPYEHGEHPYSMKMYPFVNSQINSFISDVIDQQRYINRLITLNDKVIRSSSKGVLLYPKSMIPEGMSLEDIAKVWARPDSILPYDDTKRTGDKPTQLAQNMTNIGTTELLKLQLGFMEEITGVSGALQGKPGFSGQSASFYAQQTQNASTTLLDILESYSSFILDCATKKVHDIKQFYDSKRVLNIVGKRGAFVYDPSMFQDVDFDLNIVENTETPVYRAIANDYLMQMWQAGAISVKQLLEQGSFSFSDTLLESIKADEERMAQGGQPQGVPQQVQQQITADPQAMQAAQQYLHEEDNNNYQT